MGRYEEFDRSRLRLKPLADRAHDLTLAHWLALEDPAPPFDHPDLQIIARKLCGARGARILMMGAHVLRAGVNRHIIDMMERGFITHVAMNGAGAIHDYELARIGATTESVERYIRTGEFGLWRETGELNDWIAEAAARALGLGENVGRRIEESDFPHTRAFASSPPRTAAVYRSPCTPASATTSSTNTPTATAPRWARPATAIS